MQTFRFKYRKISDPLLGILIFIFSLSFAEMSQCGSPKYDDQSEISISLSKRIQEPFWGDLKELRKRRIIRVLVSYNRTNFFITKKGSRGLEHDLLLAYEKYLNRGPLKQRYRTQLVFMPLPFKDLLPNLVSGKGDIAASGITMIPERAAQVDFTRPYIKNINEILVSNKNAQKINRLKDLSGKRIVVVANSSYVVHLQRINQALGQLGLPGMEIIQAEPLLESEDLLDMVDANIYQYTVVDNHIADIWQKVLKNIEIHPNFIIHYNGKIGWAINKNRPQLKDSLNRFIHIYAKQGRLLGNSTYKKYFESTFWIKKPLTYDLMKKVDGLKDLLHLYSDYFGFDWHLIAAQAYQESHFDQKRKSHRGAVGIMQIKPSTANERYIAIKNINKLENNIHAGIKYLAFLRDHFFSGEQYTPEEQVNFALAAYNAGPGRVRQMQRKAKAAGLDPYKWFYNVENIARSIIGNETVNYVANIQKNRLFFKASHRLDIQRRLYLEKFALEFPLDDEEQMDDAPKLSLQILTPQKTATP